MEQSLIVAEESILTEVSRAVAQPRVAVVIISFNGDPYLRAALASVLGQTFSDLEVVVVEDGSRDNAESIVASFNDSRARYVWRPNGGLSAARNTGIRATTAPLIAFLDCDDWWGPQKLEAQIAALEVLPSAGAVYSSALLVSEIGGKDGLLDQAKVAGDVLPSILLRNCISGSASSVMVRRSVLEEAGCFDESVNYAEDWECWIRLAALRPFAKVDDPHVYIHVRPASFGRNTDALRIGAHTVIDLAYARAPQKYRHLKNVAHANIEFGAAIDFTERGMSEWAFRPLLRAIRHDPFRVNFWKRLLLLLMGRL